MSDEKLADSRPYSGLLVVIIFGVVTYYGFPSHLFGLVQVISVYFVLLLNDILLQFCGFFFC